MQATRLSAVLSIRVNVTQQKHLECVESKARGNVTTYLSEIKAKRPMGPHLQELLQNLPFPSRLIDICIHIAYL